MAKLAKMPTAGPRSAVTTTEQTATTHEGGTGLLREPKSALFLLATSNMVGEDTFYESARARDKRYRDLVHQVTQADPQWVRDMLAWLRSEGNMRSASIVGAVEYGRAGGPQARSVLDSVMLRADEPGEALGYWLAEYGKPLPKWLKRALGDGALRLYTEASALKHDSGPVRFADVIELSQISQAHSKDGLFRWLLDRRHERVDWSREYGGLDMVRTRARLMEANPAEAREALLSDPTLMSDAGMTWESLSSFGPMDARAWEAVIPQMGYMALLRNLRNFDQAGISTEARLAVAQRLSDPAQVARSRQFPFRFFSAYRNVESDFWRPILNEALEHSISSVPVLDGLTIVMIDNSASMARGVSARSSVSFADQAALFGIALAKAQPMGLAEVWGFSDHVSRFDLRRGSEVLPQVRKFTRTFRGGGTYTSMCLQQILDSRGSGPAPRRIVIVSDEQVREGEHPMHLWGRDSRGEMAPALSKVVPARATLHTFNIGGYEVAHAESGMKNRHTYSGLTDFSFRMMGIIERGAKGDWPWA